MRKRVRMRWMNGCGRKRFDGIGERRVSNEEKSAYETDEWMWKGEV